MRKSIWYVCNILQDDLDAGSTGKYKKIPLRSLKQTAEKHVLGKTATKIKDKAQPMKELVSDKIDGMKLRGQDYLDYLSTVKELQTQKLKSEYLKRFFKPKTLFILRLTLLLW